MKPFYPIAALLATLLLPVLPTACGSADDDTPEPSDPIHTVIVAADGGDSDRKGDE